MRLKHEINDLIDDDKASKGAPIALPNQYLGILTTICLIMIKA